MANDTKITLSFRSIDGFRKTTSYKTMAGARKAALYRLGPPEIGSGYAVSGDGVVRMTVTGTTLEALFADPAPPAPVMTEEEQERAMEIALYGDGRVTTRAYPPNEGERVFNSKEDDAQAEAEAAQERAIDARLDALDAMEQAEATVRYSAQDEMPF